MTNPGSLSPTHVWTEMPSEFSRIPLRVFFWPAIRGQRVFPEKLLGRRGAAGCDVLIHDREDRPIRCVQVADRPITAVDQPVVAKNIPDRVQDRAVEFDIFRNFLLAR